MVDFGGWDMPVQYPAGTIEEHLRTRTHAGLFDVSHMGEIEVKGPDAIKFVNRSAVRSRESSARQPDLRILWKVSIFQRMAYQWSFSMASSGEHTGKLVMSFQSIGARPLGFPRSVA